MVTPGGAPRALTPAPVARRRHGVARYMQGKFPQLPVQRVYISECRLSTTCLASQERADLQPPSPAVGIHGRGVVYRNLHTSRDTASARGYAPRSPSAVHRSARARATWPVPYYALRCDQGRMDDRSIASARSRSLLAASTTFSPSSLAYLHAPHSRLRGERIAARRGSTVAIVAVARRLVVIACSAAKQRAG
jgi:hypothetical protein